MSSDAGIVTFRVDYQRVQRRLSSLGIGLATALVALLSPPAVGIVAGVLGIGALLALLMRSDRHRVRIGADAVAIELGMHRAFIPLEDIRSLRTAAHAGKWRLSIARQDGTAERIETDADWLFNRGVVASAIKEAIEDRRDRGDAGPWESRLRRGERDAASWQHAVERMAEQRPEYRTASISDHELAQLATDRALQLSARIAAAWALRLRQPKRGRRALRALIAEVVQPELREALRELAATRKRSSARELFGEVTQLLGGPIAEAADERTPRLRIALADDTAAHADNTAAQTEHALAEEEAAAAEAEQAPAQRHTDPPER